ncbi:MAG: 23S rRNA (uracil(1939)-C(5))-methyltransferase RlmD [Candidatus Omnitrophica bacterium]|nr:23S rRNA (uracil(1939)-C(5))-methyltransferase RlmD [Candidatus Omnitrophota bacterium]
MSIILASKSPRRRELMGRVAKDFTVVPSGADENIISERSDPARFAVEAAAMKAREVGARFPSEIVIGADTVVSVDGKIIGKPADYGDAKQILKTLSGTRHKVITGVAVYKGDENKLITGYEITLVKFRELTDADIEEYLAKEEYADKAGAYAIQSVGDRFVEGMKGDYDNVVGFPVKRVKKLLERFFLPEFEMDITDIALPRKWAVGRAENLVVFVPEAVYGDRVKVRMVKKVKSFSYGEVIDTVKPSPFRTEPECPYFGKCGGCAFQNLSYAKQLEIKEKYLLTTFRKIGGIDINADVELFPIIPSPDIFYYRNKMEFAFGTEDGRVCLGLRERASPFSSYVKNCISLEECFIFSPAVKSIFPVFLEFARKTGLEAYNPRSGKGFFRHLVLREGKNTGQLMAVLVTRSGGVPDVTGLAKSLAGKVSSMWWMENNRISDVVSFEKKHHLYGSPWIEERLDGRTFRIHPQSFFQPNTRAAQLMYGRIRENLEGMSAKRILGLYCGTGAIEISLSGAAEEVEGMDSEAGNINNARVNCRLNGVKNCRFHQGYVEDLLKSAAFKSADAVIVDPPRAGLAPRAMKNVLAVDAPVIIYVSCNPAALARDAAVLENTGYKMKKLYCADFFPHTTHMESMAVFEKS